MLENGKTVFYGTKLTLPKFGVYIRFSCFYSFYLLLTSS